MYLVVRILLSIPPANDYYRQQTVGDISVYLFTPSLPLSPHQANATPPPSIQPRPFDVCVPMPRCQYHLFVLVSHPLSNTHTHVCLPLLSCPGID